MALRLVGDIKNHGYFPDADPPILAVPLNWKNQVKLLGGSGKVEIVNSRPHKATVSLLHPPGLKDPHIVAEGHEFGGTRVTVKQGNQETTFVAFVMAKIKVNVTFYFVTDTNGAPKTPPAQTAQEIKKLNDVWGPQANVRFVWDGMRTPKININFARRTNRAGQRAIWAALRKETGVSNAMRRSWHVFIVRDWGARDTDESNPWGTNQHGVNMCIIDDKALKSPTPVLAHECGHFFDLDHTEDDGLLMTQGSSKGPRLLWDQVEHARDFLNNR